MRPMSLWESQESNGKISLQELFDNPNGNIDGISYVIPSSGVGNYGNIQAYVAEQITLYTPPVPEPEETESSVETTEDSTTEEE